ncbi:Protein kinase domain containing protein [Strigomonas culicis]|uniref:Protein kinase domain containing protein n=1 Tax=Strigomonas culicis TaxID=28005 RepID=S9TRM8_9TRYP|nr:Protein kinase domain containing protein [Strigomonas culicis]EPY20026.1 Protein kinase domain containing protein [Strigomonas culicis]|eukprot:EPY19128.1 Protein kinase domain containing protein [Strigomonas culicis]
MAVVKRYKWTKNFPNGDRYDGEAIEENIKDGTGEYLWAANNATYKGEWVKDVPHGEGTMTLPGVDGFEYKGQFAKGKRHGKGTCRFENGREYTGKWKEDQMSGEGTLKGAADTDDFIEYVGTFEGGYRSGPRGTCRYKDGSVYVGSWERGKRQGQGELKLPAADGNPSAPVRYVGPFHSNEPSTIESRGTAEIEYADGSVYRGGVDLLQRDGEGELRQANGDVFKGIFSRNARHGSGVLKHADGRVLEGMWRNDHMVGPVTYRHGEAARTAAPDDREKTIVTYSGPCVLDQFTGSGAKVTYADGSAYQGEVRDGVPVNQGVLEQRAVKGLSTELFGAQVVLKRYEGTFAAGKVEGRGTGQLLVAPPVAGGAGEESVLPPGAKGLLLSFRRNGTFSGQWSQGVPNGVGVWRWDNGDFYEGSVTRGVPHGEGRLKSAQQQYEGGFAHGQPDGRGAYQHLLLKERYEGGWARGLFHGEGQWVAERTRERGVAEEYRGGWAHGLKEGRGVETCGTVQYDGEFRGGKCEGQGRWVDSESGAQYEGAFSAGALTGAGIMKLPKGTIIEGHFDNGLPDGSVTVTFSTQGIKQFSGQYKQGQLTGTGEIAYMNGDHYKGEIEPAKDDNEELPGLTPQRHGKGIFTFVEGNVLECTWKHNVLHGEGKYRAAGSQEVAIRQYVDGVLSTHGVKTDDVFSPENMFPNTLSEAALKEKMQVTKKPFQFVKRGESRQAANASGAPDANGSNSNNNGSRSPGPAPSPKSRRASKTPQLDPIRASVPPTSGRRASTSAPLRPLQPVKRPSVAPAKKSLKPRVAATANGQVPSPPSSSMSPPQVKRRTEEPSSGKGGTSDTIKRFQGSIASMEEKNASTTTTEQSYDDSTPRPPRALPADPLQGTLKELMDQACAIRSTSEDEVYLLTEELRQMNERIWQLRFSMEGKRNKKKEEVLDGLRRDRISTVEKLQCLLQSLD